MEQSRPTNNHLDLGNCFGVIGIMLCALGVLLRVQSLATLSHDYYSLSLDQFPMVSVVSNKINFSVFHTLQHSNFIHLLLCTDFMV